MVGSNCCIKEPATDLDGIMAYQGWELQVAWTANAFVTVEEYRFASSGNLREKNTVLPVRVICADYPNWQNGILLP